MTHTDCASDQGTGGPPARHPEGFGVTTDLRCQGRCAPCWTPVPSPPHTSLVDPILGKHRGAAAASDLTRDVELNRLWEGGARVPDGAVRGQAEATHPRAAFVPVAPFAVSLGRAQMWARCPVWACQACKHVGTLPGVWHVRPADSCAPMLPPSCPLTLPPRRFLSRVCVVQATGHPAGLLLICSPARK